MEACAQCNNPFCSGLSKGAREKLCANAHRVTYKKRNEQVLFFDFRHILIIESGFALMSRGYLADRQQGTDILEPGSLVGIVQMYRKEHNVTLNFLPLEETTGCLVRLSLIEEMVEEYPDFAASVLREFSNRFSRVASKLAIHSYGTARQRLEFSQKRVEELGVVDLVTHEDLACLSGLSRVTVTRLLNSPHA